MRQPHATLHKAQRPSHDEHPMSQARLHHARLVMCDGNRYAALTDRGAQWVRPAAGCLLQPAIGDWVLISCSDSDDQGYILTILERATPDTPAQIAMPGDLHLSLPDGRLTLNASQGIGVNAGAALDVASQQLSASLQHATVACQTLHITGDTAQSYWQTRTTLSNHTLDVATRHEIHTQHSVRRVNGHEEVSVQSLRQLVEDDWSVCADTVDLTARDRASIQGDSVQLG